MEYETKLASSLNEEEIEKKINELLSEMTLEEKIKICSGADEWHSPAIPRLGIPAFGMTDGPHGVRKKSSGGANSTYFPPLICLASTWNPELANRFGHALGEETRAVNRNMILGPGINIHRTPLNGRTFEYMSEDPYLVSKMVVPVVKGIQSNGIAACVKHYVCNNQETRRFKYDAIVEKRALEEIYFPGFKAAVTEGGTWGIMSAYNKINGIYASGHKELLNDVLRRQWGFKGFVVSDWGATRPIRDPGDCIRAGLSLEMPRAYKINEKNIKKLLAKNKITVEMLDENVRRLLRIIYYTGGFEDPDNVGKGAINTPEHFEIAKEIAHEGIVLLKNDEKILPLSIDKLKTKGMPIKIAITGPNADRRHASGGGSSEIHPLYEITPKEGLVKKFKELSENEGLEIRETTQISEADYVIYCGGINHDLYNDAEGRDRKEFTLPEEQIGEILSISGQNPNVIVVLINGSPVSMIEWIDKVPAIIEAWYPGMEGGNAIADIIFGDVNPSGKLPLTFPKYLKDSPAHLSKKTYPGRKKVLYSEGIFVGYRHFDEQKIEPLFPFGYGLSYTEFEFSGLGVKIYEKTLQRIRDHKGPIMEYDDQFADEVILRVECSVKNIGDMAGKETVQLYIGDNESALPRPPKELKGFRKVPLNPGESEKLTFELKIKDFAYFHTEKSKWVFEKGVFTVYIGNSSRNLPLKEEISLT